MKLGNDKTEWEKKLEKAREGYASLPSGTSPFAFAERSLGRDEVILRYQRGLDLFAEVRRTREAYELAVENHRRALPGMKQFHGEAMQVARKHFGADAKTMSTFAVKCPERGGRRRRGCRSERGAGVTTEVVKEVIVEEELVSCEEQAPQRGCEPVKRPEHPVKRGCLPTKRPERPTKRGCEEAKGCGRRVTKQRR